MVRTTAGRVRGFFDGDLQVFRGIRYGADTAPRRFQPPQPPQPWRGILDAREFGAASRAAGRGAEPVRGLPVPQRDARRAPRRRVRGPVIVYIHGGAYSSGSGSSPLYDGANAVPAR